MSLEELYQQVILDHYRHPRNRGALEQPDRSAVLLNPLCGDEIAVDVRVREGALAECRFHGQGCSISQASASIMTEHVKGRALADALELVRLFMAMMRGEGEGAALGELAALRGVVQFPVRVRCATLAWSALEAALEGKSGRATAL